jgi:hypothetical protein
LSYTTFEYSGLELSEDDIAPGDEVTGKVNVTNTGDVFGDEYINVTLRVAHLLSEVEFDVVKVHFIHYNSSE